METKDNILRNLKLLKWQGFFAAFRVFVPIQYLYFQQNGLSYTDISFIVGMFFAGMFLFEVPSGIFSDRFGRRTAIGLSSFMQTSSFLIFYISESFILFLLANFLQGVGEAFNSGSDEALIFDSLKQADITSEFTEHYGARWGYSMFGAATSSLLCSLFSPSNLKLTFFMSFLAGLISITLVVFISEPVNHESSRNTVNWINFRKSLREIFYTSYLRHLVLFIVVISMGIQVFFQYMQFLVKDIGIPIAYLGCLYASFIYICGYSAKLAHRLENFFGTKHVLRIISILTFLSLILPYFYFNYVSILIAITLIEIVFGLSNPLLNSYFQHALEGQNRATTASMRSFAVGVSILICVPIIGLISDNFGYQFMMLCLALVVIITSTYSIRKIKIL